MTHNQTPAPSEEQYTRYQPTVPPTGDTVDTGWVVSKGASSTRTNKEWHMSVSRQYPIPEGLKWVPTAWKWFFYILFFLAIGWGLYKGLF